MAGLHPVCAFVVLGSLLTLHVASAYGPIMESCTRINACSCVTDTGLVIDLSPLDSGNYLDPAFHDVSVKGISNDKFSWNPCTPFCEGHCEGAAMCRVQDISPIQIFTYTTGTHNTASFRRINDSSLALIYDYVQDGVRRQSVVRLICAEDSSQDRLIPYGEMKPLYYFFDLVSKYACPRSIRRPDPVLPTQPSCPHPWTTTPATTTKHSTVTPTSTEVTPRSTPGTPTPGHSYMDLLWIALGMIWVVLLLILVFVIVLIVRLGNTKSQPGFTRLPDYNNTVSFKVDMNDTKGPIKY